MPNQCTSCILRNVLEASVQTQIAILLPQANYQNISCLGFFFSFFFYHGVREVGHIMLFIWIWLIWCMRDFCYSEEVWLTGCRRTFFCYLGLDQVMELGLWHLQGVHLFSKDLILLLSWMSGEISPFPILKMALNVLRRVLAQAVITIPLTRWLTQQTFIYFSVLKVGKSKIKVCQEIRFLWRLSCWLAHSCQLTSGCALRWWWESEHRPFFLFLWGRQSHRGATTRMVSSRPTYLPKAPPPNTITPGVRPLTYELREDTSIQSVS